jgi:hypothetical protein
VLVQRAMIRTLLFLQIAYSVASFGNVMDQHHDSSLWNTEHVPGLDVSRLRTISLWELGIHQTVESKLRFHLCALPALTTMTSSSKYTVMFGRTLYYIRKIYRFFSGQKKCNYKPARRIDTTNARERSITRTGHHPACRQQRPHYHGPVQCQNCRLPVLLSPPGT